MTLFERCTAREGKETAADIEAEVTARLDPVAFEAAKKTFRAFHASWEGSIAIAICAYLDASTHPEHGGDQ
jgi:hypothetical protein